MHAITVLDSYDRKHEIPEQLARILVVRDEPLTITLLPEQLRAALGQGEPETADPRDDFSESDAMIAGIIDAHGPLNAAEISSRLDSDHDHIMDPSGVRARMLSGLPLKNAGYRTTKRGYIAPRTNGAPQHG